MMGSPIDNDVCVQLLWKNLRKWLFSSDLMNVQYISSLCPSHRHCLNWCTVYHGSGVKVTAEQHKMQYFAEEHKNLKLVIVSPTP